MSILDLKQKCELLELAMNEDEAIFGIPCLFAANMSAAIAMRFRDREKELVEAIKVNHDGS